MDTLPRIAIQIGIVLVPVAAFLLVKKNVPSKVLQFGAAAFLAFFAGASAYYFASEHQWRPIGKKSTEAIVLSPLITSAIMGATVLVALVLLTISKRWPLTKNQPNNAVQRTSATPPSLT